MQICAASNCKASPHEDSKFCFTHLVQKIHIASPTTAISGTANEGPLFTGTLTEGPRPTLEKSQTSRDPLKVQVAGDHYKKLAIQPIEFIHANGIPFAEGSVIKYISRWRDKGGLQDLQKAKHFIDLLIDLETKKGTK